MSHAACDVLGVGTFDEDALYENLDWLAGAQAAIEDRLFAQRTKTKPVSLFLYDVTSSYLEGTHNALAAFGYNRDGKKGKLQIVIGLLCDEDGHPVSIEVFPGNTHDPHTVAAQVAKLKGTVWRHSDHLRWRPWHDQEPANRRPRPAGVPLHYGDYQTPD